MWCASLLLLSLLLVPAGDALRHGDHVVLSKRTQFNEVPSPSRRLMTSVYAASTPPCRRRRC